MRVRYLVLRLQVRPLVQQRLRRARVPIVGGLHQGGVAILHSGDMLMGTCARGAVVVSGG